MAKEQSSNQGVEMAKHAWPPAINGFANSRALRDSTVGPTTAGGEISANPKGNLARLVQMLWRATEDWVVESKDLTRREVLDLVRHAERVRIAARSVPALRGLHVAQELDSFAQYLPESGVPAALRNVHEQLKDELRRPSSEIFGARHSHSRKPSGDAAGGGDDSDDEASSIQASAMQLTRLTLVAVTVAVLLGFGIAALYVNRPAPVVVTNAVVSTPASGLISP